MCMCFSWIIWFIKRRRHNWIIKLPMLVHCIPLDYSHFIYPYLGRILWWSYVLEHSYGFSIIWYNLWSNTVVAMLFFFLIEHYRIIFKVFLSPWKGGGAYCNGQKIHVSKTDKVTFFFFYTSMLLCARTHMRVIIALFLWSHKNLSLIIRSVYLSIDCSGSGCNQSSCDLILSEYLTEERYCL